MSASDHYSASIETARLLERYQYEQELLADLREATARQIRYEKSRSFGNGLLVGAIFMAAVAIVAAKYWEVCK